MVRKEETAAGQCVACLTQKQGLKAKTRHAIFCPKGSKQSGGNSSSSLATKNHGDEEPAVGGDESVIAGTPPQSSAATVAPNVATGSGSFHPISDEDDEHLFGGPLPTAEHANAVVSEPVAGASYRAVSEARPRGAVTARKTTQLTLFGERVPDPNTLSTATAAASEPSSTGSAAPSEPQGAPIAASSPIAAAPPAAPPSAPPAAPPADEQPVLEHGLPVWAVSQLHFDTVNELAHVQSDGCSSPHKIFDCFFHGHSVTHSQQSTT